MLALKQKLDQEQGVGLDLSLADDLRIPKREVPAEVTFLYARAAAKSCTFFLSYYSPQHHGEESLAEYLDSRNSFLPLKDKASNKFFIVHIDQVVMVREGTPAAAQGGRPLRLILDNNAALELRACEPRFAWRARPIDLLNEPERFAVFSDENGLRVHVNKRFIARVEGI